MSINRVGHILGRPGMSDRHERASKLLDDVLRAGVSKLVDDHLRQYPGEQCYLMVLDTRCWIVQELIQRVRPDMLEAMPAAEAAASARAGGKRPDTALMVQVVPRAAGLEVARFLAKDEAYVQAMCDLAHEPAVMAICVANDAMVITPLDPPTAGADAGAAERARRRDRARRHSR